MGACLGRLVVVRKAVTVVASLYAELGVYALGFDQPVSSLVAGFTDISQVRETFSAPAVDVDSLLLQLNAANKTSVAIGMSAMPLLLFSCV